MDLKLSKYSIVYPQPVHRLRRNTDRQPASDGSEALSYTLNIKDQAHLIHLQKNRDFLQPTFVQYLHHTSGNHSLSNPKPWTHCYYHGEVEGYEDSMVALSTCSGLRGVIQLGNETYGLEPVPQSATNQHVLYLLTDVRSGPATCGVVNEAAESPGSGHQPFQPGRSLTSLLRRKRNLPQTSYVELVLVVDNLRYKFKKENETAVREEMVEMANLLDGYYKQLNIQVKLVGLVIFKDENPFGLDGTAGDVLGRFVKWRKSTLLPRIRHDIGQLIVGQGGYGGVLGMAFVGSVCSSSSSGGMNVFTDDALVLASTVVAHEMGHNLGMNHDDTRCQCNGRNCIMAATAGGSTDFSTCSAQDFEALIIRGGGACLRNQPSPSDLIGVAECGNGWLDEGEQCDCGPPEECNNRCCDAATCRFTSGSACADGSCCDNCQLRVAGTPCRQSMDTCDLPEFCNGQDGSCPEDYYMMDGLPCHDAYCYEGRCQTYDFQCRELFAPDPATKADDICYEHANTQGTLFGNCGISANGNHIKCTVANAKCGKVQCTNVDLSAIPPNSHVSIQEVQGSRCVNADFNLGPDVLDPAYVNPGSPCAEGKTCIEFQCVNASALLPGLDCDAKTTCHSQGVCNNEGNCHCNNGWAPPFCNRGGMGGSINSGPTQIDYSLRNGLLIFFLLVLPLLVVLVLVLLYMFRRDTLDPCLKGSLGRRLKLHKAQNASATTQPDVNVHTRTQTPSLASPVDPQYPPAATSPPISGFRYGELDYWKSAPEDPERPPPPRQGPGVPRPIPPPQPQI